MSWTITNYLREQRKWSSRTFGDGKRTIGITKHIEKELAEIREAPDDLAEWIDVMILALDGYWRHGGTPETLARDLSQKQAKNFRRAWPPPQPEDHPTEHLHEGTDA